MTGSRIPQKNMRSKLKMDYRILILIILVAFLVRFLLIWAYRPEFVGWFNHTYYYYVQTRGLISNGSLPFADMPFLFYLYAFTAKTLQLAGLESNAAIVNATRFWMCLTPSLIPVPIYCAFKTIKNELGLSFLGDYIGECFFTT